MTNNEFIVSFNELEIAFGNREDFAKISSQARALLSESVAGELHEYRCKLWLILAESLRISGKSAEAFDAAQQAVGLLSEISSEAQFHLVPKAHGILALNYKAKGDKEQTIVQFEHAIAAARRHSNREALGIWSGNFGHFYNQTSEAARAIEYYRTALEVYQELGNLVQISNWHCFIGSAQVDLSDFPQALESYQHAMKIAEELNDKQLIANTSGNLGGLYWHISDYPQAIACFQRALQHARETNHTWEISKWLGNTGIIYGDLEDYPKALDYFTRALAIDEERNSLPDKAMWLGNIGIVHQHLGDFPAALESMRQALKIDETIGNKLGVARHISNIGAVHLALGNRDSALHEFQKALQMDKEQGNKRSEAINTANIGNMYASVESELYSPEKAEEYLLRSLELNTELGTKKNLYECHLALASLYEQMNDIAKALYHHKAFHKIKEEVVSEEALHQARLLENRRKIEEAERDRQLKLARLEEQVRILHNILPPSIADRIVSGEKTIAESFENVSIFFSDIVNFTHLSATITPEELVELLNDVFTEFDILARKYHLEKIKTIGDAYMAVCGVPESNARHAMNLALFALEVQQVIKKFSHRTPEPITLRIGLHCGRAVAGIIGENKFAYDLWGDAVNTAARMESYGEAGRVHVSEDFVRAITGMNSHPDFMSEPKIRFIPRGELDIKGKGMMRTYFLEKEER